MPITDLHRLPQVKDAWSFLHVQHCRIDQDERAIAIHDASGRVRIPCAMLTTLMVGPGTSITHAAVKTLAENGCLVMWTGEDALRFYAVGMGETRSSRRLIHQARLHSDPALRLQVVRRMYRMRFSSDVPERLDLRQLRGLEGVRVREAYATASKKWGVPWTGRAYRRESWNATDLVNRALSAANSCLYGVVHGAIVSAGYSAGLGFIHTGKMLSFVYDIADLYKTECSIPTAFSCVAEGASQLESRIRRACRERFHEMRLLPRIVADVADALHVSGLDEGVDLAGDPDSDPALPGGLWNPDNRASAGGTNYQPTSLES